MYLGIVKETDCTIENIQKCTVYVDAEGLRVLEKFADYCNAYNTADSYKKELLDLINEEGI